MAGPPLDVQVWRNEQLEVCRAMPNNTMPQSESLKKNAASPVTDVTHFFTVDLLMRRAHAVQLAPLIAPYIHTLFAARKVLATGRRPD